MIKESILSFSSSSFSLSAYGLDRGIGLERVMRAGIHERIKERNQEEESDEETASTGSSSRRGRLRKVAALSFPSLLYLANRTDSTLRRHFGPSNRNFWYLPRSAC